jgi:Tol biopolymer transport system component
MCTGAPAGCTPLTTSVSVAGDGTIADDPSISADGRYVAFASGDTDLVPGDTNGAMDIFVRDTCAGVSSNCTASTVRVSVALDGTQGNDCSFRPMISADGHFVVFSSAAKLGPGNPHSQSKEVYLARIKEENRRVSGGTNACVSRSRESPADLSPNKHLPVIQNGEEFLGYFLFAHSYAAKPVCI